MNLTRLAVLLFAFVALSALAAAPESKHDKDVRVCNEEGEAAAVKAVAEAKVKHPADVTKIAADAKRDKFNLCMRAAGYASGKIRAK